MSNNPIALKEVLKAGFDDFVVPAYETAPYTTIQNRAQVTRSLKAIAGIERVMVRGINLLPNEFGSSGEQVFEADNKDSRIRFVGAVTGSSTAEGTCVAIGTADTSSYIEVTAYCTGLNILMAARLVDLRVSVDGAAETTVIGYTESGVLQSRNYGMNQVVPASSSLTLGWHTFKFRRNSSGNSWLTFGFEILNERSNLAVYSGAGISQGSFSSLSSLSTSAFNDGVVGSKGARVVKYIENGTLKSAVQEVDATAKYLTNTDHTNEEVLRKINFLEFGANRTDDFSTLTGVASSRAFTLDNGTTTLSCVSAVYNGSGQGVFTNVTTAPGLVITFVGTGLDLILGAGAGSAPYNDTYNLIIDGVNVGSMPTSSNTNRVLKICSGLSYGTHIVSFQRTLVSVGTWTVTDFIIYQPKKPSIPAGTFEVADYNLMASYVNDATASADYISTGVIRKTIAREIVYVGTWAISSPQSQVSSSTIGSYAEYNFWGSGVEIVCATGLSMSSSISISIDGLSATTANFPSATFSVIAPATFNSSTGILAQGSFTTTAVRLRISGLSLGLHKIKITNNTTGQLIINALDIITPIHISQPSLKVGSQSLKSKTKFSPEKVQVNAGPDLSKAKAMLIFEGPASPTISKSFNIASVLRTAVGNYIIYFEKPFKNANYAITYNAATSQCYVNTKTASYISVITAQTNATVIDTTLASMMFFGELIDE